MRCLVLVTFDFSWMLHTSGAVCIALLLSYKALGCKMSIPHEMWHSYCADRKQLLVHSHCSVHSFAFRASVEVCH